MKILGIIPARYGSTRFPGKPLALINGVSMVRRVFEQACKSGTLSKVIVATDNVSIFNHVKEFGQAEMTGDHHRTGTERCAEVAARFDASGERYDAVINIQGDEPFIDPRQIDQLSDLLNNPGIDVATLVKSITNREEIWNPNVVKVVVDASLRALYFSRAAIPFCRGTEQKDWITVAGFYKHIGIYGYRPEILQKLIRLTVSPLETAESLEQLRWIFHGYTIHTKVTAFENLSIDTPEDLLKITNKS